MKIVEWSGHYTPHVGSGFGSSIVHGAGRSIGWHLGTAIWDALGPAALFIFGAVLVWFVVRGLRRRAR